MIKWLGPLKVKSRRRTFLRAMGILGTTLGIPAVAGLAADRKKGGSAKTAGNAGEQIAPEEDLMREHGVLKRVLLVYREVLRRLGDHEELKPELLAQAAGIIRNFIEDYHEKLEENHVFSTL